MLRTSLFSFLLFTGTLSVAFSGEWIVALKNHVQSAADVETVAIVYNPKTHPDFTAPARIHTARVILVPLSSTRRVATVFNQGVIRDAKLDVVFLLDDYSRAVTNQATSKYLQRLQTKRKFDLLSDNPDHTHLFEESNL